MAILGIPVLEGKYPASMDLWPIEAKEFNRIYEFYDNLKTLSVANVKTVYDAEPGKLLRDELGKLS